LNPAVDCPEVDRESGIRPSQSDPGKFWEPQGVHWEILSERKSASAIPKCYPDRLLEKNGMTKRKIEYWVIPPEQDAEFVACMEEVLETCAEAYDPKQPVLCMDEQPVQLLKETRVPIAATKEHAQRVDYEYERNGTAGIFMFAEPLSGFRQATARERRTKQDWAIEVAHLLDTRYANCERVTLVLDNLNTHTKGAFYEAFSPDRARAYLRRIEFCYTPKHGSWLNVAECEPSCLTSQCLSGRRIGELALLQIEIAAWAARTNANQRGVDWQFRIEDARVKLKRLYPKIKA
jgi:DDE superfamily endonuclease